MKSGISNVAAKMAIILTIFSLIGIAPNDLSAFDMSDNVSINGYIRQRFSFNMEDPVETSSDDQFELSMARTTLLLDCKANFDFANFTVVGRLDREFVTDYLQDLEDMSGVDMRRFYENSEFREYYADLKFGHRVKARLGKQQIVWGRTDFFTTMDILHGQDYTWRSFLEPENESLRKPLVFANVNIMVPEASGFLQLVWRPGLDDQEDIGNTYDMSGGRWALQPNKGVNFLASVPYNYHHNKGDADNDSFGLRWTQNISDLEYSLAYYHGFVQDPVVNSALAPYGDAPKNGFAEFIFPEIDLFGANITYYWPWADIVMRAEIAYIFDQPYNVGQNGLGGAFPGIDGIVEKDTIKWMFGFDKNVDFVKTFLFASRPGFFNVQFHETWIQDFEEDDDIVRLAGYGGHKAEHGTLVTSILGWNYRHDTINPQLAGGMDLTHGGWFIIPSVEFVYKNNWRLRVEYDLFEADDSKKPGEIENETFLMGWFDNNDQLYVRLTYQF